MKGIFLDIGWTMSYPPSGDWMFSEACYAKMRPALDAIPKERLAAARGAAMQYLNAHHLTLSEAEECEKFHRYFSLIAEALPELGLVERDIRELAKDKVYNTNNYVFYEDVKPALAALQKRCKLGIISDTWPSATRVLKAAGIYGMFGSITFSCDLGVYKPDAKMYEHALRALGLPPEETVFVDDLPRNLEGAAAAGIVPVLIQRENDPHKTEKSPFRFIASLWELEEML